MFDLAYRCRTAIVVCASFALLASPARAGKATASNEGGGSTNPTPGSTVETGWNPHPHCQVLAGWTLATLLECLGEGIDPTYSCPPPGSPQTPGSGGSTGPKVLQQTDTATFCADPHSRSEYRVTRLVSPLPGIEIRRWAPDAVGSYEPYSLFIREDDPILQWTTIEVDRPAMVASIHAIEEQPRGGSIRVTLNGRMIQVGTTLMMTPWEVTQNLITQLQSNGFVVTYEVPFIKVVADRLSLSGVRSVGLLSTDPGIRKSELHLDPARMPRAPLVNAE